MSECHIRLGQSVVFFRHLFFCPGRHVRFRKVHVLGIVRLHCDWVLDIDPVFHLRSQYMFTNIAPGLTSASCHLFPLSAFSGGG